MNTRDRHSHGTQALSIKAAQQCAVGLQQCYRDVIYNDTHILCITAKPMQSDGQTATLRCTKDKQRHIDDNENDTAFIKFN